MAARTGPLLAAITFTAAAGCTVVFAPPPQSSAEARVAEGRLVGEHAGGGVAVFRGIPFASPPVGDRRWRAPEAPGTWEGARDATTFAPPCPQDDGTAEYYRRAARRLGRDPALVPALPATSEDCLYLNVWTPAAGTNRRLPILVWVHGGAGTGGSASDPLFDGAALARHGLVVVTVAYRLGALGFLAHPSLSADDPRGASGNYALLDIVRALEWIRINGAALGGDSANVTLSGQSAGATLAHLLLVSPAADGLVQRLVAHSGNGLVALRPLRDADEADTVRSGEARGRRFVRTLGLGAENATALRAVSVDSLLAAARRSPTLAPSLPVVDGVVLREQPAHSFARGAYHRVPILTGFTGNEASLFMAPISLEADEYRTWIEQRFGSRAGMLLTHYPPGADPEATRRQRLTLMGDEAFRASILLLLRWSEGRNPVYVYSFAWQPDDGSVGAFHSADVPFLFDTHGTWWTRTSDVAAVTRTVQAAWARFAATGSPAGSPSPSWPASSADAPAAMVVNVSPAMAPLPRLAALREFADSLSARLTR